MVFLSYFIFPFKNKTKISGDSKSFSKNWIFTKQNKKRVSPSSGNASRKWEVHSYLYLLLFQICIYIYIHIYLVNCMYSYHKFHGPFFGMVHHITKLTFQFSYFFSLFLAHLIYFNLNLFYFMNLYILVCVSLIIFSNPLSFSFVFSYERLLKFHI